MSKANSLRSLNSLASRKTCRYFVLLPKSPKLNAHVERSHRTHNEEFCQVQAESDQLPSSAGNFSVGSEPTTACAPPIRGLPDPLGIHYSVETESKKGKVSLIYWTSTQQC